MSPMIRRIAEGGKGRAAEQGNEHPRMSPLGERAVDGAGDDVHQEVDEAAS